MDKLIRNSTAEFLIFTSQSGELDENSVVKDFLTTANDSKTYNAKYYNLDTFISVGCRVNSKKIADEHALGEFEKYRVVQDRLFMNDFDKLLLDMRSDEEED